MPDFATPAHWTATNVPSGSSSQLAYHLSSFPYVVIKNTLFILLNKSDKHGWYFLCWLQTRTTKSGRRRQLPKKWQVTLRLGKKHCESPRTSSHSEKRVVDSMSEWVYVVWQEVTGLWHKTSTGASYSSSAGSYAILGTYLCYLSLGVLISKIEILMLPSYSIIMKVKYIRNNRFEGLIFFLPLVSEMNSFLGYHWIL